MEQEIINGKAKLSGKAKLLLVVAGIITIVINDTIHWAPGADSLYIGHYIVLFIGFFLILSPIIISLTLGKGKIFVTDKRVYGTAIFGKRVDLPLDAISAVATGKFNGISITTASGAIQFLLIKNRDEIHKEITKLLVARQEKSDNKVITKQETTSYNADELKKFKELLDSGVITEEEFDAKKKQLLGL